MTDNIMTALDLCLEKGDYYRALSILFYLIEGDPTYEAGWYAFIAGICYEKLNDNISARYWYNIASQKNPIVKEYSDALKRMPKFDICSILKNHNE